MEFSCGILRSFKGKNDERQKELEGASVYISLHLVYISLRAHVFAKNQVKAHTNCKNYF